MLKDFIYTTVGVSSVFRKKIKRELKELQKSGKLKKCDVKEFLKKVKKKGNKEDKELKKKG